MLIRPSQLQFRRPWVITLKLRPAKVGTLLLSPVLE